MSYKNFVIYWVSDNTYLWVSAGSTVESRRAAEDFIRSHGYTVTGTCKVPTGTSREDILKANKPSILFR